MEDKTNPKVYTATVKKRGFWGGILDYAIHEEIEPRSKELMRNLVTGTINMLADSANKSIDKAIYPDGNAPKRVTKSSGVNDYHPRVNYNSKVITTSDKPDHGSVNTRSSIDIGQIWVGTQEQANDIITYLLELIDNYGKAKVADLYDKLRDEDGNKITTTFTDFTYGWTKQEAGAMRSYIDRGQYYLDLPKPVDIRNV